MKNFKITYHLRPDADDVEIVISAKDYDDACIYAKSFRKDGFSVDEIEEDAKVYEIDTWRGNDDLNKVAIAAAKKHTGRKFVVTFGEWGTTSYLVFADSKEEAANMVSGDGKRRVREVTNCKKYN